MTSSRRRRPSWTSSCRRREVGSRRSCGTSIRTSLSVSASRGRSRRTRSRLRGTASSTVIPRCFRATAARAPSRGRSATGRARSASPSTAWTPSSTRGTSSVRCRSRSVTSMVGRSSRRSSRRRWGTCSRASSSGSPQGDPGDPQDESVASYFHFFEPEYAWIDRSRSTDEVERQVRAWRFHSRVPGDRGALAELDGETVRVLRVSREPADGPALTCADGTLWIVETEAP